MFVADQRAIAVLETVVLEPGSTAAARRLLADEEARMSVARCALALCDPARIAASLHIEGHGDTAPGAGGDHESTAELAVCWMARRFGCSPAQVMALPYEAFLSAADCLQALEQSGSDEREQRTASIRSPAQALEALGVRVLRPKARA